jgi:xylulose-5-phosphate/fructose-6-phosphate phosphoketolase
LLRGYRWTPFFVVGDQPEPMHEAMTPTLDLVVEDIRRIQHEARVNGAQLVEPR